jgi:uncharacterized protein (DUF2147 family)
MKRFCSLLALMALSSSAHADSFSFVVAGRTIHIEAPRHCRSASCVSVSIPGLLRSQRPRDRDDEVAAAPQLQPQPQPAPANPPSRTVVPVAGVAAPASPPPVQPVASQPVAPAPPSPLPPAPAPQLTGSTAKIVVLPPPLPSPSPPPAAPAASAPQTAAPPPPPKIEPVKTTQAEPSPSVVPKSASVPLPLPVPVPVPAPQIAEVSQKTVVERADTPLGDWQTEGNKGTVRIERCGEAMCGYLLNAGSTAKDEIKNDVKRGGKGDTILINMKPKSDTVWSGNIYSRSSGHAYYATMTMKGADTIRVEACGLGHFFCSGNDWTRIENGSKLVTYQPTSRPPS